MQVIGTHSGSFHADDALGVAMLQTLYPAAKVVRSRDPAIWETCDALVDVGGVYDPQHDRYDHHQNDFREVRDNGIPYAGAGLVWRTCGARYASKMCPALTPTLAKKVSAEVDARLIQHADAVDSGITVPGPQHFGLAGIIGSMNGTWQDSGKQDAERFAAAVALAATVLRHLVITVAAELTAADTVREGTLHANGRILVLTAARLPYEQVVWAEMPDVLFVVYPDSGGQRFVVRVVQTRPGTFEARADLPEAWAGLQGPALAQVTGVSDAVFCHKGRFITVAQSLSGALQLAELAVAQQA